MNPRSTLTRLACCTLTASLLVSSIGCVSGYERAVEAHARVKERMTRPEVVAALGWPDRGWPQKLPMDAEYWGYYYGPNSWWYVGLFLIGAASVVTLGVAFLLFGIPYVAYRKAHLPYGRFTLHFGPDGYLFWKSEVEKGCFEDRRE